MAAKGSRKDLKISKKRGKELQRHMFGYDNLSYILLLCGFPKEKIGSKERKPKPRPEDDYVSVRAIVLTVALSKRDDWKTMFESRFKSSGFDSIEKIELCLKCLLAISVEFRKCDPQSKMHICLAAYSELMLFFNYKGIEFDFEQMVDLWSRHLLEIDRQSPDEGVFLDQFFTLFEAEKFFEWFSPFVEDFATPYGCRDGVSKMFLQRLARQLEINEEQNWELAEEITSLIPPDDPVMPEGFESVAVLPGDRVSPELPESSKSSVPEGEKKPRSRGRSTGHSEGVSEGRRRKNTVPDLGITDRLGQMSLSSEQNRRKQKDRKSH